jgi:hypothetical protein
MNMTVTLGTGATADHATISAGVQGPTGAALSGVAVAFVTTQGTLTPSISVTDGNGFVTTTLVARATALVTATAGQVSVQREVATQPPNTSTPTPSPSPVPNPTPTPIPGNITLNLPSTATANTGVNMFVSGSSDAGPIAWSFGDGATDQTSSYATSHTYTAAGTYTVTATGLGIGKSASATIAITSPSP